MAKILVSIFGLLVCMPLSAATAGTITPNGVLTEVQSYGASKVLPAYYDHPQWQAIINGIGSADPAWLNVYQVLQPVADGAAAEDLDQAIFAALPRQPFRVLPFLQRRTGESIQALCTFSFESRLPEGGAATYVKRLRQALNLAVGVQELNAASECRRGLAATEAGFHH